MNLGQAIPNPIDPDGLSRSASIAGASFAGAAQAATAPPDRLRLERREWMRTFTRLPALAVIAVPMLGGCGSTSGLGRTGPENPFTLGVASGYPSADGMVLWTRLAPRPEHADGGLTDRPIAVDWVVAEDEGLRRVVARGRESAQAADAHSLHVEVRGLRPARDYWYRFHTASHQSVVGRTRTLPLPGAPVARLRLAVASCQQYEHGFYGAYRHMVADDPDLIVHLGDYIYEGSWGKDPVRHHGSGEAVTLADYRLRHMLYRLDPDLQRAHGAAPWVLSWDDHEVANDYADDVDALGMAREAFLARRAAAYRAWYEHMPVPARMKPRGPTLDLFAGLQIGSLASLNLLDGRQYRSRHACPPPARGAGANRVDPAACPELGDPARTMLGERQERWLDERLRDARARWTLIGQQTLFAPNTRVAADGRRLSHTDGWDGYPAARSRLLQSVQRHACDNPVVLGGDVHAFYATRIDDAQGAPLASEFVCTSVSSQSAPSRHFDRIKAANPHILHADGSQRGYLRLTIEPARLQADMVGLDDVRRADTGASVQRAFVVEAGRRGPIEA